MPSNNTAQPDDRDRQQQALDLRLLGHSYENIAKELGYADRSGARKAVLAILDRRETEAAEQYRRVEGDRLDKKTLTTWTNLRKAEADGDHASIARYINALVRISERRCKLLGLDAPTQVELGAPNIDLEAAAKEIMAVLGFGGGSR